jgi:hypothetical protein
MIAKANQAITFNPLQTKTLGDPDFAISATATSGLTVTFTATGGCSVSGATVHIIAVGLCTITANQAGNANYNPAPSLTKSISVYWPWTGFLQPVDNLPIVNTANAGQAIPVKFQLGGNRGLSIFQSGAPRLISQSCNNSALVDAIETTVSATSNSLTYDAASNTYNFVWKTDKTMAGKCLRLDLGLIDGSTHQADFRLN